MNSILLNHVLVASIAAFRPSSDNRNALSEGAQRVLQRMALARIDGGGGHGHKRGCHVTDSHCVDATLATGVLVSTRKGPRPHFGWMAKAP